MHHTLAVKHLISTQGHPVRPESKIFSSIHFIAIQLGVMDVLITASFVAIATAAVAIVIRKFQRFQEVSQFSRLNGCQTLPHESDFWYDYLGIFKVVELALNFRQRKFLDYTNALFARYGDTYASNIFGQKIIFTYNEQNIRHVLTTGFSDYDSPQLGAHLFRSVTPKSIFTADGPEWKRMRNLLRSQFSNNRSICDLDMFEKHVQNFIQSVPPNGEALDLQARLADLCLDITTCFTLGESVDALSPTQFKEKKRFAKDMIYIKETIARHGFLGPLGRLTRKTRFYNACAGVQEFVQFYADRALARNNEKSDGAQVSGRDPRDYAFIRGLTEHTKDVSELTDQSLCLLLAAVDSVTTVLSATFFLLARNEPVAKKLRASILDSIGNNPPTYDQLKTFRYMRCVFNEGELFADQSCLSSCFPARSLVNTDIYEQQCGSFHQFH